MESDKQQQQPMIIAMKGPLNNKKRQIAFHLAEFFHYPLIDEEDIIAELEDSLSNDDTISFKILTKITKTQLQLKLQLILNTSLSHNDPLLDLAMSKGARLLIIECKDGGDQIHDFYQDEYAWIACIDVTKPFEVEEFAQKILDGPKDNKKSARGEDKIIPQRIFREAHAHEFFFTEEPKMKTGSFTSSSKLQCCNYCEEVVSGPTYQCIVCDEFIFHESCAEFYTNLKIISEEEGPMFYLEPNPNPHEYEFPQTNKCRCCETYSSDCNNCLLQTHIKCGVLPTIWRYKEHDKHSLSFVIMPFWCKYQYQCIACSKYGTYMGYKCYGCNIDLHVSCALKEVIKIYNY